MRNPATFLPAVCKATPHEAFDTFLNGRRSARPALVGLALRLRAAVPEVPITVWCNEDTPLIWGEVLREMAGIDLTRKIIGALRRVFRRSSAPEGMQRFRAFLKEHPNINEMQKRRVMTAFLDKYALDDAIEEELDLPGWDEDYVAELSEQYEEDLYRIERIPGVTVITP